MGWNTLRHRARVALLAGMDARRLRVLRAQLCPAGGRCDAGRGRLRRALQRLRPRGTISMACNSTPSARRRSGARFCRTSWRSPDVRLVPAIDLLGGRCVRLLRGDFAAETRYAAEPRALLARYRSSAPTGCTSSTWTARATAPRATATSSPHCAQDRGIKLQVGGGLRDRRGGRSRSCSGRASTAPWSAAPRRPSRSEVAAGCSASARSAWPRVRRARSMPRGMPASPPTAGASSRRLALGGGRAVSSAHGLQHVLCTDVSRDGALTGPNVDSVRRGRCGAFRASHWQASGGVRDARDLQALAAAGAAAAISGKALLEELIPLEELRPFLPNA